MRVPTEEAVMIFQIPLGEGMQYGFVLEKGFATKYNESWWMSSGRGLKIFLHPLIRHR